METLPTHRGESGAAHKHVAKDRTGLRGHRRERAAAGEARGPPGVGRSLCADMRGGCSHRRPAGDSQSFPLRLQKQAPSSTCTLSCGL